MTLLLWAALASFLQASPSTAAASGVQVVPQDKPADETRVELTIRPSLTTARGAIRATAMVEPHAGNKSLTLAAECPDYLRRSTIPLEGTASARKHTMLFESLPACVYDITATLHREDGKDIVVVQVATVKR
jgi:hypothetical protein